ncbi:glycine-rich domain-containing protein [Anaerotignum sp. MB30-C6]|uniref:glycine-rich domain-containing protein n=1 Tax=Anaerotignum sp. MB30-C6 TaxID=3070814 RepID=UPI0027DC71C0|nr:hypothetical protein [Anaerotignum sp. MB30-C6]WMI82038.1 hypothetical protein RBQ60_04715 [Anaerotignum sp. MB30-C6]
MAEFTGNFKLEKPAQNEFYNVEVQNQNMDKIDAALAEAGNDPQLEVDVAEIKARIGTTVDTGGSETGGTIFAKLNKVIHDTWGMVTSIGKTDDTGATETTGTVMGKLNKLVHMDLNVTAKIVCKGLIGTKFTISHNDKYLDPFVIEITVSNSVQVEGNIYAVITPVPIGNYNVVVELSGKTKNSTVNVSTVGEFFMIPYSFYTPIQNFTTNGTLTIPEGVSKIFITAIGGGGYGGRGAEKRDEILGGPGGGGGDKGELVIKKEYAVTPGSTHAITIGTGGYIPSAKDGKPTIMGTLLTLSGGLGGTDATSRTNGTGHGSAGNGGGGSYGDSGKAATDVNGGAGGAKGVKEPVSGTQYNGGGGGGGGGGGIDFDGEQSSAAKGGDGGQGGKNTGGYASSGENGSGYGSGGGGGGGMGSSASSLLGGYGGSGKNGIVIIYTGINIVG